MRLVHITGKKGSGKNTILEIAKARGHLTEEVEHGYRELLGNGHQFPPMSEWKDHIIRAVFEQCWRPKYPENASLFFTGLYRPMEIAYLKDVEGTELRIVSIEVNDDQTRYHRLLRRARTGEEHLRIEDYERKDLHRAGVPERYKNNNISTIMQMADYKISNDGPVEEFIKNAHELISFIEQDFLRR